MKKEKYPIKRSTHLRHSASGLLALRALALRALALCTLALRALALCALALCTLALCTLALCALAFLPAGGHSAIAQTTRIIFLHHSCGENLIVQGGVREGLTALGYEFYDHGYNDDGLRLANGLPDGTNFDVPDDNTDPDGLAAIFAQPLHDPPDNTFSHLMQYDVIAFKSCFPVSNIGDDAQLATYQSHYLAIRDRMDQYPEKTFIIVTQPPQVPANSDPQEAARARALANWLQSDEYLAGHPNVSVFDFFGLLAGEDNFLRPEYRVDEYDAHPNELANQNAGPLFVEFIHQAIRSPYTGSPRPTPTPPAEPPVEATPGPSAAPTQLSPSVAPSPKTGTIDDLESTADLWESSADGMGSNIECVPDTGVFHGGSTSLRIRYSIVPNGWADFGRPFDPPQDWSSGTGLSLWLHSDQPERITLRMSAIRLMLFAGDPAQPTPFEVTAETTGESTAGWEQLVFPWADFARAEWADEGGLTELDPARVTGLAFNLSAGDAGSEGTLWMDDVSLATDAEALTSGPVATPTNAPAAPDEEEGTAGGEEGEEGRFARRTCLSPGVALSLSIVSVLLAGCHSRNKFRLP